MNKQDLQAVLDSHAKWLAGDGGERADLSGANLSGANLSGADLSEANLSEANLSEANLSWANLSEADLRWASLCGADLCGANLSEANLSGADLREANLRGADLRVDNLSWANLSWAIGILLLPVQDMRGYSFAHAIQCREEWRVRAGCRDFSIDEALAHWGSPDYKDRERGDMYVYAVEWLRRKVEGD